MLKLYGFLRNLAHPAVWLVLLASLYGLNHYKERLYWETPSIPFQPFCNPKSQHEHIRPAKGITMSQEYRDAVVLALAGYGVTMKPLSNYQFLQQEVQHPLPILIAPKDFNDGFFMINTTEDAILSVVGKEETFNGKKIDRTRSLPLKCEDIEGKVTRM